MLRVTDVEHSRSKSSGETSARWYWSNPNVSEHTRKGKVNEMTITIFREGKKLSKEGKET